MALPRRALLRPQQCARVFSRKVAYVDTKKHIEKHTEDSPRAARKRVRDKRTVSQMVSIYCHGKHKDAPRDHVAHCGELVCAECAKTDAYAILRTEQCARMEVKVSCDRCPLHCYTPDELEKIREIMRYSGPRMMFHHPIAALRHLTGK